MTSNQHDPYVWGYTRVTMVRYKLKRSRKVEPIGKNSSQFGLRSATRPHEVGIASNRISVMVR